MARCHSVDYESYMHSRRWAERKRKIYERRGHVCERCGADHLPTEVHHLNYDRLGHELDDDLQVVCVDCHPKADAERKEWEARRQYQREHPPRWATLEEIEILTMRLVTR